MRITPLPEESQPGGYRLRPKADKTIDICLNCPKEKCTGKCELLKRQKIIK
jgi:hypothetical protein